MDNRQPLLEKQGQSPPASPDFGRTRQRSDTASSTASAPRGHGRQASRDLRSFPVKPIASVAQASPTSSPNTPLTSRGPRPYLEKNNVSSGSQSGIGSIELARGSVDDTDTLSITKPHMIRGKWVAARLRTICYMFIWLTAVTTFLLVVGIYIRDYLPHKTEVDSARYFNKGNFSPMPNNGSAGGYNIHAWPSPKDIDLNGVYLIIAWCGVGTVLYFVLWLQNTYRSARSYYVKFTRIEVFSLVSLIVFGIGFGATAGYVTYTFKLDNNYNDFWSYTCSREKHGEAQVMAFKNVIYYDGDCEMLTAAWATLLVLCAFSLFALLTFPINLIYHARTRHSGYSRFEQRISKDADLEDRLLRRASLRPKEPWKMPKWAKMSEK